MPKRINQKRNSGFTLVELLVVIAIIGILIGLLIPAVQKVREAARRTECSNNIRNVALASISYESTFRKFPIGFQQFDDPTTSNRDYQGHSVFYYILPYMEQDNLFKQMDRDIPLNNRVADPSLQRASTVIKSYICPSDLLPVDSIPYNSSTGITEYYGGTSYRANGGERPIYATSSTNDGMFMAVGPDARKAATAPAGRQIRHADASRDGLSNTLLFGEFYHDDPNFDSFTAAGWNSGSDIIQWSRWYPAGGDIGLGNIMGGSFAPINYQTPWAHGDPGAPTSQSAWWVFQDQRLSSFGSGHTGGANFAFGDGSTRFVSELTAQNVLRLYCNRNDREVIPQN